MREFKFRAWDKTHKQMYACLISLFLDDGVHKAEFLSSLGDTEVRDIDDIILMQYTGLRDKNDKEIFEGDYEVNAEDDTVFVIVFKDGMFGYNIHDYGSGEFIEFCSIDSHYHDGFDFSKNIYENPLILEV